MPLRSTASQRARRQMLRNRVNGENKEYSEVERLINSPSQRMWREDILARALIQRIEGQDAWLPYFGRRKQATDTRRCLIYQKNSTELWSKHPIVVVVLIPRIGLWSKFKILLAVENDAWIPSFMLLNKLSILTAVGKTLEYSA